VTAAAAYQHSTVLAAHLSGVDQLSLQVLAAIAEALAANGVTLSEEIERLERRALPAWAAHLESRMQRREGCQGRTRSGAKCKSVQHPHCRTHRGVAA
jgi:hypothetical protein